MFPLPTVPTENLYKFLALGGIILIITTLLLFLTESQKLRTDSIKLTTSFKIHNSKIDKYNNQVEIAIKQFESDSIALLTKKIAMTSAKVKSINGKKIYSFVINNKRYTSDEYADSIANSYEKAARLLNAEEQESIKSTESSDVDVIKLDEQKQLIELNSEQFQIITYVTALSIFFGGLCSAYGFKCWYKMKIISDELSKMQHEKARKELELEKKIIM